MHRWSQCAGSVKLSIGIPNKSSIFADEGTRAHELAADLLNNRALPKDLDDDMLEGILKYVEVVRSDAGSEPILVEQRFDLSSLYPGMFGTADAVIYHQQEKLLRVIDLKFGKGIIVEPERNPQMMFYALGAMISLDSPCEQIELVIIQPRANHVDGFTRRWQLTRKLLLEFKKDLVRYAKATEDPNAPLVSGEHCRFCPAAGICPELKSKALAVSKKSFTAVQNYDPMELSETLSKLELLEDYAKSVREFAYLEATHGRVPPGFKLVEKRATRKWKDEPTAAELFRTTRGEEAFDVKLKSPAQMEKLYGKEVVAKNCVAVSSGLTLVPESDKRQAAKSLAESSFKPITDQTNQKGE